MQVRNFRQLLILSVVLPVVGVIVDMSIQDQLPGRLAEYAAAQSSTMPSTTSMIACLMILVAWIYSKNVVGSPSQTQR